jgi:hypothetical protein
MKEQTLIKIYFHDFSDSIKQEENPLLIKINEYLYLI